MNSTQHIVASQISLDRKSAAREQFEKKGYRVSTGAIHAKGTDADRLRTTGKFGQFSRNLPAFCSKRANTHS